MVLNKDMLISRRIDNMFNIDYIKAIISKFLRTSNKNVKPNIQLQQLYDSNDYYEVLMLLQEYNLSQAMPFLACGMSCYFNNQVNENGLSNLKLSPQDIEDAKFIASCFGKTINYSDNNLSTLYTTLLGTTEFNYGMQTFPAGIFEDVFQCSSDHSLPIQPIVGESESDYYCRVLDYQISQFDNFPTERKSEALARAKRLASNFCNGKNRIYLIPFENVASNKTSFGDVEGLRDGKLSGKELEAKLDSLYSFEQLLQAFDVSITNGMSPYDNPNMTSEYGIAIYGTIASKGISFFEIDRMYDLIQKKARDMVYTDGDVIPNDFDLIMQESSRLKK